jgi:hypothetical protein
MHATHTTWRFIEGHIKHLAVAAGFLASLAIGAAALTLTDQLPTNGGSVGINWFDAEQANDSGSQHAVVAENHPTDRGPGYDVLASRGVATPSSRIGFDRDVATTYLAQRAQRTAKARDGWSPAADVTELTLDRDGADVFSSQDAMPDSTNLNLDRDGADIP